MAEEVEIIGVDGGPASEATLQKLLDAMSSQGSSNESQKVTDKYNEAKEKGIKVNRDFSDEIEDTTDFVEDLGGAAKKTAKGILALGKGILGLAGNITGMLVGTVTNLAGELIKGSSSLTDFAAHVPIFGSVLSMVTGIFDDTLTVFQDLSSSGASFNNNLTDLRVAAAESRMSLAEFAGFIGNNTEKLAAFGGTVTQGAMMIPKLNKALGDQRQELLNMGLSFEEINENLADYMYLNRAGALTSQRSTQETAAAAADYTKNLMTLSKLTGKDVKQLKEAQAAKQADIGFQMKMAKMSEEERDKVNKAMAMATAQFGDAGAQAVKQAVLGMGPLTRETKMMAATMPGVYNALANLGNAATDASVSQSQFDKELQGTQVDAIAAALESAGSMEGLLTAGAAGLDGVSGELLAVFGDVIGDNVKFLDENGKVNKELIAQKLAEAKAESGARDPMVDGLTRFQDSMKDLRTVLEKNVLGPLSTMLGPVIQDLSGYIKEFTAGDEFSNIIADFKDFVDDFIADFKDLGLMGVFEKYIMKPLQTAMSDIPAMIKKLLFGSEGDPDKKAELEAKKKTLQMQMTGAGPNDIKNISEEIAKLDEEIAATSETTGVFSDIFADIPFGAIALGIGGVLGALVVAGSVATFAAPGLAAIGGALTGIGIAAGGIGVLLFGISSVMDSVGENAEEIGHIIDRVFAGIQGTIESVLGEIEGIVGTVFTGVQGTIESVGIAIERVFDSIGGAVAAPIEAIGGVIDKYRELKEAGKDNSAENVALLANIPAGRISGIADEILELNESLAGIDSGFSFGAMLGGDEFSSQVQALSGLGNLGDVDFKVTADGVKDLVKFTEDLDEGAVRRYTEAMENLVEVLEKLNEEMEGQTTGAGTAGGTSPAGAALTAMTSGVGSSDKLDELNNTMKQVLLVLQEQYGVGKRTLKATKQGGNVF